MDVAFVDAEVDEPHQGLMALLIAAKQVVAVHQSVVGAYNTIACRAQLTRHFPRLDRAA
jgi:hypothetical protein